MILCKIFLKNYKWKLGGNRCSSDVKKYLISLGTGGKKKSGDDPGKKRREKISPIPLLQKIDSKLSSPNSKKIPDFDPFKRRHELMSPSFDLSPSLRCDKCFFSFYSKEQVAKHKCLNSVWSHGLRLPAIDKSRDFYHHPINLKLPDPTLPYMHPYYQNYHYPSPPMDTARHLATSQQKVNPISVKNFWKIICCRKRTSILNGLVTKLVTIKNENWAGRVERERSSNSIMVSVMSEFVSRQHVRLFVR